MSAKAILIVVATLLFLVAAVGVATLGPFVLLPLGLALWCFSSLVP